MVYSTFRLCKINIKSVTEMRNIIRMVGIGVAALCMVTPTVQAQVKLNANNIDEVIGEMTLEEKVHMVIGCGMSMGDGAKFPEQPDGHMIFPV